MVFLTFWVTTILRLFGERMKRWIKSIIKKKKWEKTESWSLKLQYRIYRDNIITFVSIEILWNFILFLTLHPLMEILLSSLTLMLRPCTREEQIQNSSEFLLVNLKFHQKWLQEHFPFLKWWNLYTGPSLYIIFLS